MTTVRYLAELGELASHHGRAPYAYVLMTNHVYLRQPEDTAGP